jgi:cellobiose phosphorylase
VIPANWKGFTDTRRFRGNTYFIEVKNPTGYPCRTQTHLRRIRDLREKTYRCAAERIRSRLS